ncbi:hypothetical protein SUGI_0040950 [Cryptomeria japonica]|nr:hypothetical protein SUGI_0040950 [Cryptomeria japonica]
MEVPEEEIMDFLWKDLPKDIMEMVLLFLPLASAMQFKSVGKEWREFLASNCYYSRRSAVEQRTPWLFLCNSGKFSCAFDFSLKHAGTRFSILHSIEKLLLALVGIWFAWGI